MFTLALAQMFVAPGEKKRNLAHAVELIARAASQKAQAVLLPETMSLGWTDHSARELADSIPSGETFLALQQAARDFRIYVCSGLVERAGAHLYNSAVLISPAGELLLHHRKINELDIARDLYSLGDRIGVVDTEFGRVGLMICADAFVERQVISRSLGEMGAKYILSPCAWAVPADHDNDREPYGHLWLDNYIPICSEFRLWIAGCSNVGPITSGPWAGRKCIGCSLVINPEGKIALRGPYGENAEAVLCVGIG
jgi:predicted amidohydrolase